MQNRGMCLAEGHANFRKRGGRQFAAQVHCHLTRQGHALGSMCTGHIRQANVKIFRHIALNDHKSDRFLLFLIQRALQKVLGQLGCHRFAIQRSVRGQPDQSPLKDADIRLDMGGNENDDIFRQLNFQGLLFETQNSHARLKVRRNQFRHQAPLKTRDQSLFQVRNFVRRPVAGHNDLLMGVVQNIKGVKKLLLQGRRFGQKMNIVNQQQVGVAIFIAEVLDAPVLKRVNVFIHQRFAGNIIDVCFGMAVYIMSDGLHQVRFTEPRAAVNKERVIGLSGCLGHGQRGGMGKLVGRPHHERRKQVFWIQRACTRAQCLGGA